MQNSKKPDDFKTLLRRLSNTLSNKEPGHVVLLENFLENKKNLENIRKELDSIDEKYNVDERYEVLQSLMILFECYSTSHEFNMKNLPLWTFVEVVEVLGSVHGNQGNNFKALASRGKVLIEKVKIEKYQRKAENENVLLDKIKKLNYDYKDSAVFPPREELLDTALTDKILPHMIKGTYYGWTFYANNMFYLLKEDFFRDLRFALKSLYLTNFESRSQNVLEKVFIYDRVRVLSIDFKWNGTFLNLSISPTKIGNKLPKIRWESTKRLLHGALVLICSRDMKILIFAIIQEKASPGILNQTYHKLGFISLTLQVKTENFEEFKFENYQEFMRNSQDLIILETKNYFEPYKHFLNRIQNIKIESLPFKNIIIEVNQAEIKPPSYLKPLAVYKVESKLISKDKEKFTKVSVCNSWPNLKNGILDTKQYDALKALLTKEVAIIQGPPGTGKTFIGATAVRVLLDNKKVRLITEESSGDSGEEENKTSGEKTLNYSGPILVVCQTNHALDQFLSHIIKFTTNIVRVGGRCQAEEILPFVLSNTKSKVNHDKKYFSAMNRVNENIALLRAEFDGCIDDLAEKVKKDFFGQFFHLNKLSLEKREEYEAFKNNLKKDLKDEIFSLWIERDELKLKNLKGKMREIIREKLQISKDSVIYNKIFNLTYTYSEKEVRRFLKIKEDEFASPNEIEESKKDPTSKSQNNQENDGYDEELVDANTEINRRLESGATSVDESGKEMLKYSSILSDEHLHQLEDKIMSNHINCWRLPIWCVNLFREYTIRMKTLEMKLGKKNELMRKHEEDCLELSKEELKHDLTILKKADVVGMTLTGCAKYSNYLDELGVEITIIEEAAEVLEAQNLCIFTPHLKHLILIGDHKQLRPKVYNYEIERNFHFNISLFERLVKNGVDCISLDTQRRMRPEIADFVREIVYKNKYHDHSSVKEYKNMNGLNRNMFFIQHSNMEESGQDFTMKYNQFEIEYVFEFANYLVKQNYKASQITILTFYLAQFFKLRSLLQESEMLKEVTISTVDNYQGEENDIVILSLVRSNDQNKIGFIKEINRICVALSRAKMGLFVIGNFGFVSKFNHKWYKVQELARRKGCFGEELELVCNNHKFKTTIKSPKDFEKKCPDGGCFQDCNTRKKCGHICKRKCHNFDHNSINCKEEVEITLACKHIQKKKCFEKEKECATIIEKKFQGCGHTEKIPCFKRDNPDCPRKCERMKDCGHKCHGLCGQDCKDVECKAEIQTTLPCTHIYHHACSMKIDPNSAKCEDKCNHQLQCGHSCQGNCAECLEKSFHQPCTHLTEKTLYCYHKKQVNCSELVFCNEKKEPQCPKGCSTYCGFRCEKCVKDLISYPLENDDYNDKKKKPKGKGKNRKAKWINYDPKFVAEVKGKYIRNDIISALETVSLKVGEFKKQYLPRNHKCNSFIESIRNLDRNLFPKTLSRCVSNIKTPAEYMKNMQTLLKFLNYLPKAFVFYIIENEAENLRDKVSEKFDRHLKTIKSYFSEQKFHEHTDNSFWESIRIKLLALLVYIEESLKMTYTNNESVLRNKLEERIQLNFENSSKFMQRSKVTNPNLNEKTVFKDEVFKEINSIYFTTDSDLLDAIFLKEVGYENFFDQLYEAYSLEWEVDDHRDHYPSQPKEEFKNKFLQINSDMVVLQREREIPKESKFQKQDPKLENKLLKAEKEEFKFENQDKQLKNKVKLGAEEQSGDLAEISNHDVFPSLLADSGKPFEKSTPQAVQKGNSGENNGHSKISTNGDFKKDFSNTIEKKDGELIKEGDDEAIGATKKKKKMKKIDPTMIGFFTANDDENIIKMRK